jgi:hypothetical protein
LQDLGYRLIADLGAGLLGRRWKVQPIESAPDKSITSRIAEIVEVENPVVESLCDNLAMLVGVTEIAGIGNVIAAHWVDDKTFVALIDIDSSAHNIPAIINPDGFWDRAAFMFNAIKKLHAREVVHGAICRDIVYVEGDNFVLGDLWWAHDADGKPLHESFRGNYLESLPRDAWAFVAPEVLKGEQPSRQSDIYSLGALWFYLLCGQLPRVMPEKGNIAKVKKQLLEAPQPDLLNVHPEFDPEIAGLVREMMRPDPAERAKIFHVEAALLDKATVPVGREIVKRKPFELTSDLYVGISLVPPELTFTVLDVYFYADNIQVGIDQGGHDLWMTLEGIATIDGAIFFALSYAPDSWDRADADPVVAVQFDDKDCSMTTLTSDEFEKVRYQLHIAVQKRLGHNREYVESILGKLREWND